MSDEKNTPPPAAAPSEVPSADVLLLRETFALCEATEDECANADDAFKRGRAFEAKRIRRGIGTWYQDTLCGRSHMGEPVPAAAPTDAQDDWHTLAQAILADAARYRWLREGIIGVLDGFDGTVQDGYRGVYRPRCPRLTQDIRLPSASPTDSEIDAAIDAALAAAAKERG